MCERAGDYEACLKQSKILMITWIDSCSSNGWQQPAEAKARISECQSVGFLVEETKDAIALALSRTTQEGFAPYADIVSIPKVAIKRKRVIRL